MRAEWALPPSVVPPTKLASIASELELGESLPRLAIPLAKLLPRLCCPECRAGLVRQNAELTCGTCARAYGDTESGQLDLRPRRTRRVSLTFDLGDDETRAGDHWPPMRAKADPAVDFSGAAVPYHLSRELLSWFPKAGDPEALALDLGCGTAPHRGVCEEAGFTYVGVDNEGASALVLADAHCLPFEDACFDFVLSIAVLEHVRFPFVFMREVARVLRPGGTFIGTVAFLEPFHAGSYYHHTHLGLLNCLAFAQLEVVAFGPVRSWPALRALAEMALFPPLPGPLSRLIVSPLQVMHRLWWRLARAFRAGATDARRRTWTAGAFEFVASKPDRQQSPGVEPEGGSPRAGSAPDVTGSE